MTGYRFTITNFTDYSPVRVDFAGGWLDTPGANRTGGYLVNCAVSPLVSKNDWLYSQKSGLGGSSAWAFVNHNNPFEYDYQHGNGWQDSAVVLETGCCVWHSGNAPVLDFKNTGDFLQGKMALFDTHKAHDTGTLSQKVRDFDRIKQISHIARTAVLHQDIHILGLSVSLTYQEQRKEGMTELPKIPTSIGMKYCGSGHGGYALYLFENREKRNQIIAKHPDFMAIEPYCRLFGERQYS